jgi:hypothetical protein
MMKIIKQKGLIFLLISILLAVVSLVLVIQLVDMYGPRRPQTDIPEDTLAQFQPTEAIMPTQTATSQPEPTPVSTHMAAETLPTIEPTPSPSPTPEWMVYDEIDFRDQEIEILINMACEGDQVYLNPFNVVPYRPELIDSGLFYSDLDFSIAWEHLGYYGLWIHSGQSSVYGDLPAYPLQIYIENDERGYRRYPEDLLDHINNCLIGAELRMRQGETLSISEVVAAVRVPPPDVDEVSRHPMELVPYLAEKYPDSSFDRMEAPGLLFYFCGRQLSGEAFNSDLDYWTQSRIIIGFMPVTGE